MPENIYFYKGLESALNSANKKIGGLYYCTDTTNTYIYTDNSADQANGHSKFKLYSSAAAYRESTTGGIVVGRGSASGPFSISEGDSNMAIGEASHAEGRSTEAHGLSAHSEGCDTIAYADYSHAEGDQTYTGGITSHAEGYQTRTNAPYQHVQGKWNNPEADKVHIVGWGTSANDRKNIHTIDTEGNAVFTGIVNSSKLIVGQGEVNGEYSIAGGTNDKTVANNILGYDVTSIPDDTIVEKLGDRGLFIKDRANEKSEALGSLSVAYGTGNQSITATSNTIGIANQAGSNGFYIHKVLCNTDNTLTIYLNDTQKPYYKYQQKKYVIYGDLVWQEVNTSQSWSGSNAAITSLSLLNVNDIVSFSLFSDYNFAGKITKIEAESGKITLSNECGITSTNIEQDIAFPGETGIATATAKFLTLTPYDFSINFPNKPHVGVVELKFGASATGLGNSAAGSVSNAHGIANIAAGTAAFVTGRENIGGFASLVGGYKNIATGNSSFAIGQENTASGLRSFASGYLTVASKHASHTEGIETKALAEAAHAEGKKSEATGIGSHAEGIETKATETAAHAEGYLNTVSGKYSHVEGQQNNVSGEASHAEGYNHTISGNYSHAEGQYHEVTGNRSHAEGYSASITGNYSHGEGYDVTVSGDYAHAEGAYSKASANCAHAEGGNTEAGAKYSHAEGYYSKASGEGSHAEGNNTIASGSYQHVQGKFNSEDPDKAFIIGNGTGTAIGDRSNALTIDWNGNAVFAGSITSTGATFNGPTSFNNDITIGDVEVTINNSSVITQNDLDNMRYAQKGQNNTFSGSNEFTGTTSFKNSVSFTNTNVKINNSPVITQATLDNYYTKNDINGKYYAQKEQDNTFSNTNTFNGNAIFNNVVNLNGSKLILQKVESAGMKGSWGAATFRPDSTNAEKGQIYFVVL